ncbi:MAG TPA: M20/M25/M40 family metallo-hydrolase, partial [Lachnospiraceae bacterium]|nr:M20/M25/M40 family metallo-hydrolase [Lachnospiraceae bacterium]
MNVLENLKPEKVFQYFEKICQIPHGSGNTESISRYCEDFAKARGLAYNRDRSGNIVIYKSGSCGYEDSAPVILQGHLDMVCENDFEYESRHDFKKDPLHLAIMDDYVYAKGTTLGGDDGIAVAYMLAILDDNSLSHPPLEAVFTVDEEIGMKGAAIFDTSCLCGKKMLNIDNEMEGELLTSSAGGSMVICEIPVRYGTKQGIKYNLLICGLQGGHSGTEIDKYRGNANLLMGRLLHYIGTKINYDLSYLKGGLQDNAIPR